MTPGDERPIRMPDFGDLELLVAIARCGSIGQAATELGIAQPSASRRIAMLERSLRLSLLRRGARGSSLTPAGRVVVDWALTLLRAANDFRLSVEALGAQRHSMLRAGVSMTIAEHYAPTWLARVRQESPHTVVSLSMGNSTEVMDMVEAGQVDLGVIETPAIRESLQRRPLGIDRLAVAVAPDHAWARRGEVSRAELAQTPLLVREPGSGTRRTLDRALADSGVELTAALEMASNTALKSAAIAGLGPVVLAEIALADDFDSGALVRVEVSDLILERPLTLIWTDASALSPEAVTLFLTAARLDQRTHRTRR